MYIFYICDFFCCYFSCRRKDERLELKSNIIYLFEIESRATKEQFMIIMFDKARKELFN